MESHRWWDSQWWLSDEVLRHSKYTKEQVTIGLEKLRQVFDERWFKAELDKLIRHPVCKDLVGLYPFKLDFLVKLGLDLKEIERCANIEVVIKRIRSASEFVSACSVIEMAASLRRRNLEVEELDPHIGQYNPDFSVRCQGHLIYFEVKTLDPSAKWIISGELQSRVHWVFNDIKEKCYPGPLKVHLATSPDFWKTINLGKPGSENAAHCRFSG